MTLKDFCGFFNPNLEYNINISVYLDDFCLAKDYTPKTVLENKIVKPFLDCDIAQNIETELINYNTLSVNVYVKDETSSDYDTKYVVTCGDDCLGVFDRFGAAIQGVQDFAYNDDLILDMDTIDFNDSGDRFFFPVVESEDSFIIHKTEYYPD